MTPRSRRLLFGRDEALAWLRAADAPIRVVLGPPGVGKTALVRALTEGAEVAWCDLAAARGGDELLQVVGAALQVPLLQRARTWRGRPAARRSRRRIVWR